jgi:poly-gamma-glutamate synthesis protein (capsule biosynthesis protein)
VTPGFIPCWIDDKGRPEPRRRSDGGQEVVDYVESITRRAGLRTRMTWRDDTVVELAAEDGVTA